MEPPGLRILYEEKANLKLAQVRALVEAGVVEIQPGIEALSTSLLRLMGKGTTAAQNIALLRYGKACGPLQWNLLHGFPNEELAAYAETLALMPLLHHLQPPVSPCPVVFDRFSPYHEHPERYGITALRPFAFYRGVYPTHVPLHQLAYHFEGDCACVTRENPDIVKRLGSEVVAWRKRYFGSDPAQLRVEATAEGYRLIDTRGLPENPTEQRIDAAQAMQALVSQSGPARGSGSLGAGASGLRGTRWQADRTPAVAEPALLARFEQQYQATHKLTVLEPAESPWPQRASMAEPRSPALPRPALATSLRPADVVLVVPPFAWIDRPSLGLHLLQATARRLGFKCRCSTPTCCSAATSVSTHNTLCRIGHGLFLAERMFARAAYDTPASRTRRGEGMRPRLADLTEKYARANLAVSLGCRSFRAGSADGRLHRGPGASPWLVCLRRLHLVV